MEINTRAQQELVRARAGLVLDEPFFGTLSLRLKIVQDPTCGTLWTDGKRLGYNPDFALKLTPQELKGVICHEIMHCVFRHQTRRGDRNHIKWNIACDYAINNFITKDNRYKLPEGALVDKKYDGMTAEHIYDILPIQEIEVYMTGEGVPDPGACGEIRDSEGSNGQPANDLEKARENRDWQIATTQAANAAKAQGKLPGHIAELMKDFNQSKVPWQNVLRNFMTSVSKDDYSFTRPNRRFAHMNMYLPSMYSEALGEVVIAVDTSASVSREELKQFGGEISSIIEDTRPKKVHVIYCDTQVNGHEEFTVDDMPLELSYKGRGGTCFTPAFDYAREHVEDPVCFIYLTDMGADDFPEVPPPYPVLWISTTELDHAPFGETLRLEM